jgi:putative transposase
MYPVPLLGSTPDAYRWSSYHANATGNEDGIMRHHAAYRALGGDAVVRGKAWRALVKMALLPAQLADIRATVQTGTPLGNARFRAQIEQTLGRWTGYERRGRPATSSGEKGY